MGVWVDGLPDDSVLEFGEPPPHALLMPWLITGSRAGRAGFLSRVVRRRVLGSVEPGRLRR